MTFIEYTRLRRAYKHARSIIYVIAFKIPHERCKKHSLPTTHSLRERKNKSVLKKKLLGGCHMLIRKKIKLIRATHGNQSTKSTRVKKSAHAFTLA